MNPGISVLVSSARAMLKNLPILTKAMSHKEVDVQWYVLFIFSMLLLIYIFKSLISPTGLVVFPETSNEKVWDFDTAEDYIYDSSLLVMNGAVQLKSTSTTASVTIEEANESSLLSAKAYKEGSTEVTDSTSKVSSIEVGHMELKTGQIEYILEVKLDKQLQNNDVLSLYLLEGTDAQGKLFLCTNSSGCTVGAYSSFTLPATVPTSWYNLTLSSLSSATDTFFLDSPDKIKIDMVKGYAKSTRTETSTSTSYSSSSSIETNDLQPTDWKSWGLLSKTEQLNGQTVNYFYSTNSGSSWTAVPANLDFSAVTGSKIRFKVELNSNTTSSPVVDTLTLAYLTQQPCTESWSTQYGSCLKNDSKLKYYTDVNECGKVSSLPADNNTYVSCDYCALFNCSGSVIQKPVAETKDNKTIYTVDAVNKTNTKLEIEAGTSPAKVDIVGYSRNIKNETPAATAVNRYIDIHSDAAISSVKIILYYNDSEITALDENTLKIYYYNETSKVWGALPSTVNVTGNYVSATVPHLSLYGLFGDPPSSDSGSSASTSAESGGGSGGGSRKIALVTSIPDGSTSETVEIVLPTKSEPESTLELNAPASEIVCEYVVEMSLPDELVLGEGDSYEGEVTNKGNCAIPELKLGLSPELELLVGLSALQFGDIQPGDKQKFILIRKKVESPDLFSATSYVIGSLKAEKSLRGQVILQGYDETGEIFSRKLPVSIILKNSFPGKELAILGLIAVVLLIFAVKRGYGKGKKKKK